MTLTQLEIFSLLIELNGFSKVAARLGITQSAISHTIGALENEFGTKLFIRNKSALELTDAGKKALEHAKTILNTVNIMKQEVADVAMLKTGSIRIGSFGPTSSIRLLPKVINTFNRAYPQLNVNVVEGQDWQIVQWLIDNSIDIGFVVLPNEQFTSFPIARDCFVALLPSTHSLAQKDNICLHDFIGNQFILTGSGSADIIMEMFKTEGITPIIKYKGMQLTSILESVAEGTGLSIVAKLALPDHIPDRCVCKPIYPIKTRTIGLAVVDELKLSPASQAFWRVAFQTSCIMP